MGPGEGGMVWGRCGPRNTMQRSRGVAETLVGKRMKGVLEGMEAREEGSGSPSGLNGGQACWGSRLTSMGPGPSVGSNSRGWECRRGREGRTVCRMVRGGSQGRVVATRTDGPEPIPTASEVNFLGNVGKMAGRAGA